LNAGGSWKGTFTTGTENGQYSELTVVRNLFYDVDHAMLSKDGGFITAVNNTVVKANRAAVNLYEARSGQWQGKGFYGDGNIFHDVAHVFANPDWAGHPTSITMNNSIFPTIVGDPIVWIGGGNLEGVDPQLWKASSITSPYRDMRLLASSPAVGTGPNGRDMGALVPPGASIGGEPFPVTWRTAATLTVGGPDLFAYKYRINDGPWSEEVRRPGAGQAGDPLPMPPIELTNLQNGRSYTVFVLGKDSAGFWQNEQTPTASRTWIVDVSFRKLVLNEVLAINESAVSNGGAFPDMIELYYDGPAAINLAGMSLSNDPSQPAKFVFPSGASMRPGEYLVLFADNKTTGSGYHVGFSLNTAGDSLYLFDRTGELIDSVEFGSQLPDLSIGRIGPEGLWRLTTPTFGRANLPHPLGDPRRIRINEWLAAESVLFESDFIELYNPGSLPVDLGGFYLTDTPETEPDLHRLPPLTFIAGGGYAVFTADGGRDPGRVQFKLSSKGDMIALFDAAFNEIDKVIFLAQTTDISQGRIPDGADRFNFFLLPTPGLSNSTLPETIVTPFVLVPEGASKRAIIPTSAGHIPDDWKILPIFDDSAWMGVSGSPGGVGFERSTGYEPFLGLDVQSVMYGKNATCYVRVPFQVGGDLIGTFSELRLSVRYDDGFVAYLNGQEVARVNAPDTLLWNSAATGSHEASYSAFDETFDLSDQIDLLHAGSNLLAFHAMNNSVSSSDFLISATLEATSVEETGGDYPYLDQLLLLEGLRVTELMYNAPQGEGLDYIELFNVLTVPLDLAGVRFTAGIDFVLPSLTLEPGGCLVVAGDPVEFRKRYGGDIAVVGPYAGRLSNSGEEIVLKLPLPFEAAILRFRYSDRWHPITDGGGESLAIKDSTAAAVTWSDPESWTSSVPNPGRP
ncbi:MAG TPA: lamin tail domain-containing protein, partial [Sedimentisphaerales bacterium]|nr:lamin tail domain-containing protein [Sedimentisphaerales bacterium]